MKTENLRDRAHRMVVSRQNRSIASRDPLVRPEEPYVAVLGGTETYGKYVDRPFAQGLAEATGRKVINLGCLHGGLTLLYETEELIDAASQADLTVLQVLGAQNVSNRLYMVHPRRNDRFLRASPALVEMFPGLDFMDFNFTGHLMEGLSASPDAYNDVVEELRTAWVQRMLSILEMIKGDVLLLWLSARAPEDDGASDVEPMFVNRAMLEQVLPAAAGLVEVLGDGGSLEHVADTKEAARIAALPSQATHDRTASEIARIIGSQQKRPHRKGALKSVS